VLAYVQTVDALGRISITLHVALRGAMKRVEALVTIARHATQRAAVMEMGP